MGTDWKLAVENARTRADAVKAGQAETAAAAAASAIALFALPPPLDPLLPLVGGIGVGFVAGFEEGAGGDAVRLVGRTLSTATGKVAVTVGPMLPEVDLSATEGMSFQDIKKFGVAGTLAYILTEIAFWIVAFPVASTSFYNLNGHWPDFGDNADRTAVLAFIFAGANIARLAVPLRFAAAFALVPWVDENLVQRFSTGGDDAKPGP